MRRWLMPGDHDQDVVSRVPQVGDIALKDLLCADFGGRAVLLANVLERASALVERPQDAVSAFSNFLTVEPG